MAYSMGKAAKYRMGARQRDIAESYQLLLELVTSEPTLQQCFKIIESTCLSQGVYCRVDGADVTERFQQHLDEHYVPFLKSAIRAFFAYGFVPYRIRKISRGDRVPEVLPAGTFTWHTELGRNEKTSYSFHPRGRHRVTDDETRMVVYRVSPRAGGWKEEDVSIYVFKEPALDVCTDSMLYATVPSPLAHVLTDYKNLRQAQIRRSHADAWNTTAKIISTFDPKLRVEDNPSQYLMDFVHEAYYDPPALGPNMFPPIEAHNVWQRESVIRRQFQETPTNHLPDVYALPRDHQVASQQMLAPCEDLAWLLDKYRRDVSSITGVPYEMFIGKDSHTQETVRKTIASGRLFSTNMHEICRHLQAMLRQIYREIYSRNSRVDFLMVPMPRLEVETIADFKTLFEIGALTPDMSVKLSRILLGEEPGAKRRRTAKGEADGEGEAQYKPGKEIEEAWQKKGKTNFGE